MSTEKPPNVDTSSRAESASDSNETTITDSHREIAVLLSFVFAAGSANTWIFASGRSVSTVVLAISVNVAVMISYFVSYETRTRDAGNTEEPKSVEQGLEDGCESKAGANKGTLPEANVIQINMPSLTRWIIAVSFALNIALYSNMIVS